MSSGAGAGLAVAGYLRPEEGVVPFRARPELTELLGWCVSGGHAGVRLVTGDGGAGKTRLALRLGDELAASGWQPLWVPRGSEREAVSAVHEVGQPCVLVVDYSETRSDLAGLLDDVAADAGGPDLRVVLLARSAGEWWQQLLAGAAERTAVLLESGGLVRLGPVRATGGTREIFSDAVTAFARRMGTGRPDAVLALSDPDPVVLVVHAAALLAVADHATGARPREQPVSGQEVLAALLRHEARYWARSAASRGLDLDLSVLRHAVAVACLIGADSETAAGVLLARFLTWTPLNAAGGWPAGCMTCIPPRAAVMNRTGSGWVRCGRTGSPSTSSSASWYGARSWSRRCSPAWARPAAAGR
jgi:hypothetical protein